MDRRACPVLAVVVPCYNEEEVLPETIRRIRRQLDRLIERGSVAPESYMLLVDDGSKDNTWPIIAAYHERDASVRGLKLACNVGHQHALLSGLLHAKDASDCAISIDADLQDDVEAFGAFVEAYRQGSDIVYGVRAARKEDTWFKRESAMFFYRLMRRMGTPVIPNHADYRLMSAKALGQLACYRESNLFLRGLIPQLGLRSSIVTYDRHARFAGESKYPLRKMISFAWNGITSLSVAPIRLVMGAGFAVFAVALLAGAYALYAYGRGATVPGWTSMMLTAWLLGGVQLISLGIVGEYVGKVYKETKRRPPYFIEATASSSPAEERPRPRPAPAAHPEERASAEALQ